MLTDAQCRNATCPADKKRERLTDSAGLYLRSVRQAPSAGSRKSTATAKKPGWRWAVIQLWA